MGSNSDGTGRRTGNRPFNAGAGQGDVGHARRPRRDDSAPQPEGAEILLFRITQNAAPPRHTDSGGIGGVADEDPETAITQPRPAAVVHDPTAVETRRHPAVDEDEWEVSPPPADPAAAPCKTGMPAVTDGDIERHSGGNPAQTGGPSDPQQTARKPSRLRAVLRILLAGVGLLILAGITANAAEMIFGGPRRSVWILWVAYMLMAWTISTIVNLKKREPESGWFPHPW